MAIEGDPRADQGATPQRGRDYLPALRWKALTPLFDTVVGITTRERPAKQRLLDQAEVQAGDAVLDLGAGTGTLAIWLKQRRPEARVAAFDADPEVLSIARRKATDAKCEIEFVEGHSTELPFPADSFDIVLTLFEDAGLHDAEECQRRHDRARGLRRR